MITLFDQSNIYIVFSNKVKHAYHGRSVRKSFLNIIVPGGCPVSLATHNCHLLEMRNEYLVVDTRYPIDPKEKPDIFSVILSRTNLFTTTLRLL
jgi:hypothetical protein